MAFLVHTNYAINRGRKGEPTLKPWLREIFYQSTSKKKIQNIDDISF